MSYVPNDVYIWPCPVFVAGSMSSQHGDNAQDEAASSANEVEQPHVQQPPVMEGMA